MRTLGLISIGIAAIGLLAYYFMRDSAPEFVIPLIIVSGVAAVFFILAGLLINMVQTRKKYECLQCGFTIRGGNPVRYGIVCPSCGGNAFS